MLLWILLVIIAIPVLTLASYIDNWGRDLTQNSARTMSDPDDPRLAPLHLSLSTDKVETLVVATINDLPLWETDGRWDQSSLRATRSTAWLGFVDDITVRLSTDDQHAIVNVVSNSRVGKGDLGQNPRNIDQLLNAIRSRVNATGSSD